MGYKNSTNIIWAQTVFFIIYQAMSKAGTGRYPLKDIYNQFSSSEQSQLARAIEAFTDRGFFILKGSDICITNRSEALLNVFQIISERSEEEVNAMLKSAPSTKSLLDDLVSDRRLMIEEIKNPPRQEKISAPADSSDVCNDSRKVDLSQDACMKETSTLFSKVLRETNILNKSQKIIMIFVFLFMLLLALFPPFIAYGNYGAVNLGYHFILSSPLDGFVNVAVLWSNLLTVVVMGIMLTVFLGNPKAESQTVAE